jgi:uncharacterized glyoxalase superfamily protein PhnB
VTPRIAAADPARIVAFVRRVFGAAGEYRADRPTVLRIGDSRIMIGDARARGRATAFLYVYVAKVDPVYRRALAAGARSIEEPADLPYGDRRAMVVDPWGNSWQIAAHKGNLGRSRGRTSRGMLSPPKSRRGGRQ